MTRPTPDQLSAFLPYADEARTALMDEISKHPSSSRAYGVAITKLARLERSLKTLDAPSTGGAGE